MARTKSKPNTNAKGNPLTIYITDVQNKKLERIAAQEERKTGYKVSKTAIIRNLIDDAKE